MTPHEKYRKFVEEEVARIQEELNLQNWRINIHHVKYIKPYEHIPSKGGYTAEVEADHVYLEADVFLSKKAEAKYHESPVYFLQDLYHELIHILIDPIANFAEQRVPKKDRTELLNLEERLTQVLSIVIHKLSRK